MSPTASEIVDNAISHLKKGRQPTSSHQDTILTALAAERLTGIATKEVEEFLTADSREWQASAIKP